MSTPPSHYFDDDPDVPSAPQQIDLVLPDGRLHLTTDRGVFGHGRVDAGTKFLLLTAPPPPPSGHVLDLGCGYGPIALTMARRSPGATVWAVDVNERARDLCRSNAERNGLSNVVAAAPDDVPVEIRFAALWSNPAIRIGKPALHDMLLRWLARLDGDAYLVVHKHLGSDSLQSWLDTQGYRTERLATAGGYRVLHSQPAAPRSSGPRRVDLDPH
ncbi:MAG: class I SAM-dependent methyltransferase [Ilumatobacteraceae bacterium]